MIDANDKPQFEGEWVRLDSLLIDSFSGEWGKATGNELTPVLRTANFNEDGSIDYSKPAMRFISASKVSRKAMKRGDIVLEKSGGTPNRPVGIMAYFDSDELALCSNFNQVLRFNKEVSDPRYMFYQLCWLKKRDAFVPFTRKTTGLQNLQMKTLGTLHLKCPKLAIQKSYAENLLTIQRLIKLHERYQKDLDQLIKSRFVEMFGDPISCPKFLKQPVHKLAHLSSGATPSRKKPEYYAGRIPWVKTGEVAIGNIDATEEHLTEEAIANSACHVLPAGTILIAMYGQGDTRGKAALLNVSAATNQACAALEFNEQINALFALIHLHLCYEDLRCLSHGGNQKNLSLQIIRGYEMMVPPIELQQQFAGFVRKVDKLKFAAQEMIDKLQMLYDSLAQEYFSMPEEG